MMRLFPPRLLSLLAAFSLAGCAAASTQPAPAAASAAASPAAEDSSALAEHRRWWSAFAVGDTAYLQAHTAPVFSVTVSTGRTYDRAGMLARAATHADGGGVRMDWSEESARFPAPGVAVVTSRVAETNGGRAAFFRYLTVLERGPGGWRASMGQTTREATPTPDVDASVAGPLGDYAGEYRTPRGGSVRVVVRDSALGLVEPSGREVRLVPIGPALFEYRSPEGVNSIVRFVFTRDAAGRIAALQRLAPGEANTWTRVP
jgi:hypothetical protein